MKALHDNSVLENSQLGILLTKEELAAIDLKSSGSQTTFLDKYIIAEKLEKRKYGLSKKLRSEVWAATGKYTKDKYIIKIIDKKESDSNALNTFKREVSLQRRISHKHSLKIIDYFENTNKIYVVVEYSINKSLSTIIWSKGRLSEIEAYSYFFQTCSILSFLHEHNIIHRDLRPENMQVWDKKLLKLSSYFCCAEVPNNSIRLYFICLIYRKSFCGAIEYMAPEIVNHKSYDRSVDIWATTWPICPATTWAPCTTAWAIVYSFHLPQV